MCVCGGGIPAHRKSEDVCVCVCVKGGGFWVEGEGDGDCGWDGSVVEGRGGGGEERVLYKIDE